MKTELAGEVYEAVFIRLWDALRQAVDPWEVVHQVPTGTIVLGTPGVPETADHSITVKRTAQPVHRLDPAHWQALFRTWKTSGYRLEQSEWRHTRFEVVSSAAARSDIEMTLHVSNPRTDGRWIVKGTLKVSWDSPSDPEKAPFPAVIDASHLQITSRQGAPQFDHVVAADFTPERPESRSLDPNLQVYDLDGDGLPEIVLAVENHVFWNRGGGRFQLDQLLTHPLQDLRTGLIADFDGDGTADFLAVDRDGLALFSGDAGSRFPGQGIRSPVPGGRLANPSIMTAGDIDGDGDLDVWLGQYKVPYQGGQMPTPFFDSNDGYPAFLLINRGDGRFDDHTAGSGLAAKRFRRTYSASFVDLDDDKDLDLLVVSDFAGIDLYRNNGRGRFSDVTTHLLAEPHCFGMSHTFGDFDRNGQLDFLVIGMNSPTADRLNAIPAGPLESAQQRDMRSRMAYGNRLYLRRNGSYGRSALSEQVARTGWSWGVANGDFDNDGDLDLFVVNGHLSGRTARDYEGRFWRHDIHMGGSDPDPALDLYFQSTRTRHQGAGDSFGGFEKNRLLLNQGGNSVVEAGFLMGVALEKDCRNAIAEDLDGDGRLDLLTSTFEVWPKPGQLLHLYPNFLEGAGNWIGVRLRESGPGFSPMGARVELFTAKGKQIRICVSGDSYRSQHSTTVHFGIGTLEVVERIEVAWSNGRRTVLENPEINQYHRLLP
ncbi:MAG: CRTAC1 family protein [Verrucomicrobia bacterium]|nr:CRTAC1 family protein [Verrucomicrobiota bacterium]